MVQIVEKTMQRQSEMYENIQPTRDKLFESLCSTATLMRGFKSVKENKGAPGIDGISIETFESRLDEELNQLVKELSSWSYEPKPVRRVEIPKPQGGIRLLGVPCVRDRVVQATMRMLLEPILDPQFSSNSYGFRPGRNQRQAVEAAQKIVESGKEYVVDIDLSKFFDRIHHDRLISRLSESGMDKRILRLIGKMLRSGVMQDGLVSPTTEGSVQGGPLSPLLSNVVLDELDKELERRGLEFCRFADDCNIFARTPKAAERIMQTVSKFIEKKLKLVVNRDKSKVAPSKGVKFLGMTIVKKTIAISKSSINRAMQKVKDLTPRGTNLTLEKTIKGINSWYVGWANYFSMTQYPAQLHKIEAHIRRRLRSRIVAQHKKDRHLYRKLVARGASQKSAAHAVFSNRGRWALSHSPAMEKAYPNLWFTNRMGLKIKSDEQLVHWFDIKQWVSLT